MDWKQEFGNNSKEFEKSKKVFFSYGNNMISLMNNAIRIAKQTIENHNKPENEQNKKIEKVFQNIFGKNYKESNENLDKQAYDAIYNILKTSHYYSLNLDGTTKAEYEKMNNKQKENIDFLYDDIDEETGRKASKSNMHTIAGKGVSANKISKICVGERDDAFSVLQYTYKNFKQKLKNGEIDENYYLGDNKLIQDNCIKTLDRLFQYTEELEQNNIVENIAKQAQIMKKNNQLSDLEIAKFVHIKLGKILYYDNSYTAKFENDKKETELSETRKENMLKSKTDKTAANQICKGMAEIYAEILNNVGIKAKSIGVEEKGKTTEVEEDKAKHYCTIFKIDNQEYVQDYFIESALARIKMGEAEVANQMPGICKIDEYKNHSDISLRDTNLSKKYIQNLFGQDVNILNNEQKMDLIFEKLKRLYNDKNTNWGFEEVKDFTFLTSKELLHVKEKPKIINLVKEDQKNCKVASVYEIEGRKYLLRGEGKSTDIKNPIGRITDDEEQNILNSGYEGRNQEERNYIANENKKENTEIQNGENKPLVSTQRLGKETLEEQKDTQFLDKIEKEEEREQKEIENKKEEMLK